ncbi:MAG: beta galactosidase jelly roll domain-containing protein, partial [Alphaproteobacteria bacterium]|nr:beta galactosidase jelly roll domain-containing protein [Alphaproteobacteria bacterium]
MRREALSLDGEWRFSFLGDELVPLDDVRSWRDILVPGPWQAQIDELRERNGRAWYRRSFEVPREWVGLTVLLRFGAVNYHARVFVNGIETGEHEGGYLPFEVAIGAALHAGRNELAVLVTAPTDDPALYPDFP